MKLINSIGNFKRELNVTKPTQHKTFINITSVEDAQDLVDSLGINDEFILTVTDGGQSNTGGSIQVPLEVLDIFELNSLGGGIAADTFRTNYNAYYNILGGWFCQTITLWREEKNYELHAGDIIRVTRKLITVEEYCDIIANLDNLQVNRTEFSTYKLTQGKSSMSDGDFIKWMISTGKIYSALERPSEGYQSYLLKDVQVYVPYIEILLSATIINDINELIPTFPIGGVNNLDTCVASGSYPYNYITSSNTTSPFYVENEEDRTAENDGRYDLFVVSSLPDTGGFRTVYQVLKGRDGVKENMWTRLFFNKDGEISSAKWIKCGQ